MKKTLSRILAVLLALVFVLAMTGCDNGGGTTDESTTNPTTEPTTETTTETTTELTTEPETITVSTTKDVAYGTDDAQKLDIYVPSNAKKQANNGVILVLHGGAWVSGDKADLYDDWEALADEGYIVASMNYRMPEYSTSDLISAFTKYGASGLYKFYNDLAAQGINAYSICDDIDAAISELNTWFKDNGISVNKLVLAGESAGAHEAMLYAYNTKDYDPAIDVQFVVDLSGPCDMDPDLWIPVYEDNFSLISNFLVVDTATASKYYVTGLDCLLAGSNAPAAYVYPAFASYIGATSEEGKAAIDGISPVSYVTKNTVPTIFCYGGNDITVPNTSAASLKSAFDTAGNTNYAYFDYVHSTHLLESDSSVDAQYNATLRQWLNTYFGY